HLGPDRPPCRDRRFPRRLRRFAERVSNSVAVPPFFSGSLGRQKGIGLAQVVQSAFDGSPMTTEEFRDVHNAAMPEFEGLCCGIDSTLTFVQGGERELHRLLNRQRV